MKLKVSAAVALALMGAAPAFSAVDLRTTAPDVTVVVAGASAALRAIDALVTQPETASSYIKYITNDADFVAYSITASNDTAWPASIRGRNVAIYYRSEGGSAWGPVSIATNRQILRLNVDASCGAVGAVTPNVSVCPNVSFTFQTDTSANGVLVKATTDIGVSDEEPKMYAGANWPGATFFANVANNTRQGLVNAINGGALPAFGQVFAISVNKSAASPAYFQAGNPVLSRQAISGIFSGVYFDWNQVPTPNGGRVSAVSAPIVLIRREQGSGTQVAADQFFLGTSQCTTSAVPSIGPFITGTSTSGGIVGPGVWETTSSSTLNTMVNNNPNSIGLIVADAAPQGNTTYVALDGVALDLAADPFAPRKKAAAGEYQFWYELTFTKRAGLSVDQNDVESGLRTLARRQSSAPNSPQVVALPILGNNPFTQAAFNATTAPVAFATRGKNSCSPPKVVEE